jgi:hypothetical protein
VAQKELRQEEQMGGPINCTHSELCTFLQGLEEGYLPTSSSDTTPYALSKSNPIASKSYQHGKKTVAFHGFPSLRMCKHLTAHRGEEKSMSSAEASRARTSHALERAQDLTASEAASGLKCLGLLARFDLNSRLWKTHQFLLLGDLEPFSETWPHWGMMRAGECWELSTPAHLTTENGSGLSRKWPTPQASDWKGACKGSTTNQRSSLYRALEGDGPSVFPNPMAYEALLGFPTQWTDCAPSGMLKFQQWLDSHGEH